MPSPRGKLFILPGLFAALLAATLLLALQTPIASSQEPDETLQEQALARDAESRPPDSTPPTTPLPQIPPGFHFPLFLGVDDVAVPAYTLDPSSNITNTAFTGFQVWGAAYDALQDIVYFNGGGALYQWPVGGAPTLLGTIVDGGGATQAIVSLAFHDGQLYGTKNLTTEAIWLIDPDTLVATIHIPYASELDLGGLAVDPTSGDFYATNDASAGPGRGLVRVASNGDATLITPYPAGQTDIDGLAIGPDRVAYLITDEPGFIYVYDLNSDSYLPPLNNPWTTAETFSAGAYIHEDDRRVVCSAPALAVPDNVPAGVSDSLAFDGSFTITDLDVMLDMSHTWVGDLVFTLNHDVSGIETVLVNRPGVPASTFGCSGDNIDAVIDDEGADGNVESTCSPGVPTLSGHLVGGDPPDATLLSAFDGQNPSGTWTLTVSDNSGGDSGMLNAWCLAVEVGQPALAATPPALTSTQGPDAEITRTLTISNSGSAPLDWAVLEEPLPAVPQTAASPPPAADPGQNPAASVSQLDPSASITPPAVAGPLPLVEPHAPTTNGPVYYDNRTVFDAAFPGLPLEDFEEGLWADGEYRACPAPFDAGTNNTCFTPGAIEPGVSFRDNPLNEAEGSSSNGLGGVGAGAFGATSKAIVANSFVDAMDITFDPPVNVAAMDLIHIYSSNIPVTVYLYDSSDTLLATTVAIAANAGDFWGVYSVTPIARIQIFSPLNFGDGAEGVDNVAFGIVDICDPLQDIPWVSVDPITGTLPAGNSAPLDITFDAAGLSPGDYNGNLCINSNDPQHPLLRVPLTLTVAEAAITLTKTVGLDPTVCAAESTLHLDTSITNAEVTYCYRIQNTGALTLTTHELLDDKLGPILTAFPYTLVPGASAFLTTTATVSGNTVNEATWTAGGDLTATPVSASATATVNMGNPLYLPFFARSNSPSAPTTLLWPAPPLAAILQARQ